MRGEEFSRRVLIPLVCSSQLQTLLYIYDVNTLDRKQKSKPRSPDRETTTTSSHLISRNSREPHTTLFAVGRIRVPYTEPNHWTLVPADLYKAQICGGPSAIKYELRHLSSNQSTVPKTLRLVCFKRLDISLLTIAVSLNCNLCWDSGSRVIGKPPSCNSSPPF